MGNEAAAAAQEHSGEIIHYLAQEVAPGIVIHMQTMYMTRLHRRASSLTIGILV